jgi:hypothetical protein
MIVLLGSPATLSVVIPDGGTTLGVRARVYNSAGVEQTPTSPLQLAHSANGVYASSGFTPAAGNYYVLYQIYTNTAFTTLSGKYDQGGDSIECVNLNTSSLASTLGSPLTGSVSGDIAALRADADDAEGRAV